VAKSTISKALSKHPDINEKTRQRVLSAAERYQYHPSWIAQALTTKKTRLIGLIMHHPGSGFFIEIAGSVVAGAGGSGYRITLDFSGDNPETEREILLDYRRRQIEGVIIAPSLKDSAAMLAASCGDMPYVIIDHYLQETKAPFIGSDFRKIGYLAARHLLELGHRRIAYLGGFSGYPASRARRAGFLMACREFGASIKTGWICHESFDAAVGEKQALMLLSKYPELTGMVCAGGTLAMGALRAARELGRDVPKDISIIGVSALGNISAVSQRPQEIGRLAVDTLFRRMSGGRVKPRQIVGIELDIRGTTAVPPISQDYKISRTAARAARARTT